MDVRVDSLEEAAVHIASLQARVFALEVELRHQAEMIDTLWTPPWKRLWFWLDGWPLYRVAEIRRPRPWHRGH